MMIIFGMNIRQIRHACILAEEGNFISAARRLNFTQPALSRSIQGLEASLDLRLFDRLPGGVRPTVEGRRILEHGKELLRLEAGLRKEAALLARGEAGRIAFGIGPMHSKMAQVQAGTAQASMSSGAGASVAHAMK